VALVVRYRFFSFGFGFFFDRMSTRDIAAAVLCVVCVLPPQG
jgi:hypothetical protein